MLNATNASSSFYNIIWSYYVEYLWDYEPNSVVGKIAYTFRVLAVLAILPLLVLALLDVSSYVIARTLGIVDDVKASTSDKQTVHAVRELPIIQIDSPKSPTFDNAIPPPKLEDVHNPYFDFGSSQSSLNAEERNADGSPPEYFTSEENNLKLSGFGVFSPATSQPPSPLLPAGKCRQMTGYFRFIKTSSSTTTFNLGGDLRHRRINDDSGTQGD